MPPRKQEHGPISEGSQRILDELRTLSESLALLDAKSEVMRTGINERFEHIDKKIEKINDLLTGNGTPEKGLIVRMDRLEQSNDSRKWLSRVAIAASLTALVGIVKDWFNGR